MNVSTTTTTTIISISSSQDVHLVRLLDGDLLPPLAAHPVERGALLEQVCHQLEVIIDELMKYKKESLGIPWYYKLFTKNNFYRTRVRSLVKLVSNSLLP